MFRRPVEFLKMFLGARRKWAFLLQTNASFRFFERLGVHVIPIHFYSPVPDLRDLATRPEIWQQQSAMPGVDMKEQSQLKLMHKVVAPYRHECAYPSHATDCPSDYHTDNVYFGRDSASVMHSLIRHHRPRKIIEIGAG